MARRRKPHGQHDTSTPAAKQNESSTTAIDAVTKQDATTSKEKSTEDVEVTIEGKEALYLALTILCIIIAMFWIGGVVMAVAHYMNHNTETSDQPGAATTMSAKSGAGSGKGVEGLFATLA